MQGMRFILLLFTVVSYAYKYNHNIDASAPPDIVTFDSLNVRFVGNWPFGPAYAVGMDGDGRVILGSGGGVYVLSVANPSQPTIITDTIRTRGFVYSLWDAQLSPPASIMTIAAGSAGIERWDILNPYAPSRIGTYNTPGSAFDAYGGLSYPPPICVADGDAGLRLIAPFSMPLYEIGFYDTPGCAWAVWGDFVDVAYVADGDSGLRTINIDDPANPYEMGYYDTPGYARDVAIVSVWPPGNLYAYIADGDEGLCVLDVTSPSNPYYVSSLYSSGYVYRLFIEVGIDAAYLAIGLDGIMKVDISDPHNPMYDDWCLTTDYAYDVDAFDYMGHVYVADWRGGLRIIDINTFWEIGHFDVPDRAYDLCICDQYAYIADGWGGLRILDISTPSHPREIGCYPFSNAYDLHVIDSVAYVVVKYPSTVVAIDVSTPSAPTMAGSINTPGQPHGVFTILPYIFVADGDSGLRVIEADAQYNLTEIGNCITRGCACDVHVVDTLAYVAEGDSGMCIINISSPTDPSVVGWLDTPGNAQSIYVVDGLAYIAALDGGLRIINVNSPTNPQEISYYDTPGQAYDVHVSQPYAYIADGDSGVCVVDISEPTTPTLVGYYTTPDDALGVCAQDSLIYIAARLCGVQVYRNQLFGIEESMRDITAPRLAVQSNPVYGNHITLHLWSRSSHAPVASMYNSMGQTMTTLTGQPISGRQSLIIPTHDLPSGVYFIHMKVDNTVTIQKVVLLK